MLENSRKNCHFHFSFSIHSYLIEVAGGGGGRGGGGITGGGGGGGNAL